MSQDGPPSDDGNADYNNTHRAFLQALLARQTLTYPTAKPLLAAIQTAASPARPTLPEDISQEDLDNYIHTLNATISPFDLEIRSTLHQATKTRVYALVNTTSDALTQMSTAFSADEVAFVKRVLDAMFETYNTRRAEVMAVTGMQALKLAKVPGGGGDSRRRDTGNQTQLTVEGNAAAAGHLTMSQAEKALDLLVEQNWFELSQQGFYTLSPRALMELRGWLIDTYNDQPLPQHTDSSDSSDEDEDDEEHVKIKTCQACREIVTIGQRCPNVACLARVHKHCVRTLFRAQGGREECPMCKTKWVEPLAVGEKAARGGAAVRRGANGAASGGGGRRRTGGVERESDVESVAEEE